MSLMAGQNEALENALWSALRVFDEKISINRKLLKRAEQLGQKLASQRYQAVIEETEVHAIELRKILKNGLSPAKKLEQDLPSSVRSSVHAEDVHL